MASSVPRLGSLGLLFGPHSLHMFPIWKSIDVTGNFTDGTNEEGAA